MEGKLNVIAVCGEKTIRKREKMKKSVKNRITVIAAAFLCVMMAAVILSSCGAPQNEMYEMKSAAGAGDMVTAETAAYAYEAPAMVEEASFDMASGANMEDGAYMAGAETTTVQDPNRKLIKNVYMDLETKNFEEVTTALNRKVTELGGYIECSNVSYPGSYDQYTGRRSMNLSARIPCERLDDFVQQVETAGNVTYKSENVTDVTLQYKDTESRKNSLLVEQKRLNELMKKAETVEDIIAIESRLSQVRYELESIESQLRTYDNQVDYSTVNVNINEVVDYTPVKESTVWERISEGFSASLTAVGEFFKNLFVGILAFSPIIILIAAVIAIIVLIIRAVVKKCRRKKEKTTGEKENIIEDKKED